MTDVTQILSQFEDGEPSAAEQLLPFVYDELRKLAAAKLKNEKPGQTLQPTVLVHESYLRLVSADQPQHWNRRGHFFSAAAEAMRGILVDAARRKRANKHGGQMTRVELRPASAMLGSPRVDLLTLNEALDRLEQQWPDKAKLVKLRYFAGLTIPEASQTMRISTATAEPHWRFARAWLYGQLRNGEQTPESSERNEKS